MKKALVTLFLVLSLVLTVTGTTALAAQPAQQSQVQPPCPQGSKCPGDPTCVIYPGPGDCHNNGHYAALEIWGCTTDLGGQYHYGWIGATARGLIQLKFVAPTYARWQEYVAGNSNHFIYFDNGQRESANRIYATESASVRLQVAWMECCDCGSKAKAMAYYRLHILPQIRLESKQ